MSASLYWPPTAKIRRHGMADAEKATKELSEKQVEIFGGEE
jgi:hypothetical protein